MAFWDGWGEEGGTWGDLDTTLIVVDDRIGIGIATKHGLCYRAEDRPHDNG